MSLIKAKGWASASHNTRLRTHGAATRSGEKEDEQPGYSVFLCDGDRVFHTYSTFARGAELLVSTVQHLDLTPLGQQED